MSKDIYCVKDRKDKKYFFSIKTGKRVKTPKNNICLVDKSVYFLPEIKLIYSQVSSYKATNKFFQSINDIIFKIFMKINISKKSVSNYVDKKFIGEFKIHSIKFMQTKFYEYQESKKLPLLFDKIKKGKYESIKFASLLEFIITELCELSFYECEKRNGKVVNINDLLSSIKDDIELKKIINK